MIFSFRFFPIFEAFARVPEFRGDCWWPAPLSSAPNPASGATSNLLWKSGDVSKLSVSEEVSPVRNVSQLHKQLWTWRSAEKHVEVEQGRVGQSFTCTERPSPRRNNRWVLEQDEVQWAVPRQSRLLSRIWGGKRFYWPAWLSRSCGIWLFGSETTPGRWLGREMGTGGGWEKRKGGYTKEVLVDSTRQCLPKEDAGEIWTSVETCCNLPEIWAMSESS